MVKHIKFNNKRFFRKPFSGNQARLPFEDEEILNNTAAFPHKIMIQ